MTNQDKLNKAFELKKTAFELEKEVFDSIKHEVFNLCELGDEIGAREVVAKFEWHESIYKFSLIKLIRKKLKKK